MSPGKLCKGIHTESMCSAVTHICKAVDLRHGISVLRVDLCERCRLNDWNMPGNEGLCSWPTTPVHDPFDQVAASPDMSQARSHIWNAHSVGMHKYMPNGGTGQADKLLTCAGGERLILA